MFNAVASRVREIATLRAMGFGALPVVFSVLVEAMLLGAVGGLLGGLLALRVPEWHAELDDELPDVQPDHLRVHGDAGAHDDAVSIYGLVLHVHRGPRAGHPRGEHAHHDGIARIVKPSISTG